MKRFISISVCILYSVLCIPLFAQSYASLQDSVYGAAQVRAGADFDLHFNRVTLNFGEELRFNLAPSQEFQMANTTVGLNVSIVKGYFSAQAAYTLRARINKLGATNDATLTTSTDANKVLRHRVSFGLTEQVKVGDRKQWGFSLKERAVLTSRTDSPNAYEVPANAWEMRYRAQVQYKAVSKPLTPYIWTELAHTCNATQYQKYYHNGRNFISAVKACLGLKWKLNEQDALNFYLRYDWLQDYDIDANKDGTTVKAAYHIQKHQAMLGVTYNFDWKKNN
ncbi:MAG: DUF2490 domain-containing protein [Paludibacteraceae bacterium]|nr:DUF2490 domain-containing protein [Paludibacteraceae bacterium]